MSGSDGEAADATWRRLTALVVAVSDVVHDPRDLRPEHRLGADLGLSSIMAVNLMMDLEREFDFIIAEPDFDHIDTIADVRRLIDAKLEAKHASQHDDMTARTGQ